MMISNKVHIFKYKIQENYRKELYNDILNIHENYEYGPWHNNMVINGSFIKNLKTFFIDKCTSLYGNFTILEDNRSDGFLAEGQLVCMPRGSAHRQTLWSPD